MGEESEKKSGKEMNKAEISKKLDKFETTSEKIKYLKSLEPKVGILKESERKAFYEKMGDLMRKEGNLYGMAEYYEKAGDEKIAKQIWGKLGDISMNVYKDYGKAANFYSKAKNTKMEKEAIRKNASLEGKVVFGLLFSSFLCSLIFLSGSITGNTISDLSFKASNIIGSLFFILGVIASFFYSRIKRK
jgi:hypothetical protein